jgi:hypothetical protein
MNVFSCIIAIVAIAACIITALERGLDGAILASGFAAIAGVAGYQIKKVSDQTGSGTPPQK